MSPVLVLNSLLTGQLPLIQRKYADMNYKFADNIFLKTSSWEFFCSVPFPNVLDIVFLNVRLYFLAL